MIGQIYDPLRASARPGSRWPHLALPFIGHIALGNGTQWHFMIGWTESEKMLHVAILDKGYHDFGGPVHPADVIENFKNIPLTDATTVADIINAQFGHDTSFGRYFDEFCTEAK